MVRLIINTILFILVIVSCTGTRYGSIDYPVPIAEGAVYYSNLPYPTLVLTFAPGVSHIEPDDENQVAHATVMCQYYLGRDSYPVRMHKKSLRSYLTVCHNGTTKQTMEVDR